MKSQVRFAQLEIDYDQNSGNKASFTIISMTLETVQSCCYFARIFNSTEFYANLVFILEVVLGIHEFKKAKLLIKSKLTNVAMFKSWIIQRCWQMWTRWLNYATYILYAMCSVLCAGFLLFYWDLKTYFKRTLKKPFLLSSSTTVNDLSLRILRAFKLARVIKMGRHNDSLRLVGLTIMRSGQQLFFMFTILTVFSVIVATSIYFAEGEGDPTSEFVSIPSSIWWSFITISTIGYGDIVPRTGWGKCEFIFILIISL